MADLHESLIRNLRKKVIRGGLRETKSPMQTYRPDIFAEKVSPDGHVVEQLVVEAEIPSTLFSEHTTEQLLKLDHFIRQKKHRRVRVRGILLVPRGNAVRSHAASVLESLFPHGTTIEVVGV
jgi:hypothetical protein